MEGNDYTAEENDDDRERSSSSDETDEIINNNDKQHIGAGSSTFKKRPTNLQDLLGEENLICDDTEANFKLGDISESEEIWVIDVPKTINPKNLKGQTINLGENNQFQIGDELYETSSVATNDDQCLSFVFNTGRRKRPYKTVNVKPAGTVRVRQKLAKVLDASFISTKKRSVPFPKNLKTRHPLFGHDYNEKLVAVEK